jgi:hypothetical protein
VCNKSSKRSSGTKSNRRHASVPLMYDRRRIACMRGVQVLLACTCLHHLSSANTVLHQNLCSAQASSTHQQTSVHTACSYVRKLSRAQEILHNECLWCTGESSPLQRPPPSSADSNEGAAKACPSMLLHSVLAGNGRGEVEVHQHWPEERASLEKMSTRCVAIFSCDEAVHVMCERRQK